ncbi:hypothetical protein N9H39_05015 [Gammaproteobacteria bacterium]|nr:hypothetical protein [Gammaproteobacteria bacterium]
MCNFSITARRNYKQPSSRRRPGPIGAAKDLSILDSGLRRNDE